MRRSRTLLLALLALPFGAHAAAAQNITSPYHFIEHSQSLSGFAGYLWTHPDLSLTDSTRADFGPQSAPLFGVRYQIHFSGPFSGDVSAAYSRTDRTLYRAVVNADSTVVTPTPTGQTADMKLLLVDAGLRFTLTGDRTWHGLAPYLVATGGIAADLAGSQAAEDAIAANERFDFGPAFAVGAGIGTDLFLAPSLSVRVEARERFWRMTAPEGFVLSRAASARVRDWKANGGVSVGAALHF